MVRILPVLVVFGVSSASLPCASSDLPLNSLPRGGAAAYHWTVSASDTDPFVNAADVTPGLNEFFLWMESVDLPDPLQDGVGAAEIRLVSTNPANPILVFQTSPGWLNAGSPTDLLLAVGGCPGGPVVAGTIVMLVNAGGGIDLSPDGNDVLGAVDCRPSPSLWDLDWTGLTFDLPSQGACCLPDGSCVDGLDSGACVSAGGVFQGIGSTCATTSCGVDETGACCLPSGSCVGGTTAAGCQSLGGSFQGVGSSCVTAPCPPAAGACCFSDGSCSELTATQCAANGGVFRGAGTTCIGGACAPSGTAPFGWSISASATDPDVQTASFVGSSIYFAYLWLKCCPWDGGSGLAAAEFGLQSTPGNPIVGFQPAGGILNAGSASDLLLAVAGCPCGPKLVGEILVYMTVPGSLCVQASGGGNLAAVNCSSAIHDVDWVGLDIGGGACLNQQPCSVVVSLEETTWGRLKAMYR